MTTQIHYQHIRNATARLTYAGVTFLIDPYLGEKGAYAGFEGTVNSELRNPLIDLPFSIAETLKGVDAIIVTHTHDDHWDEAAQKHLPKDLPMFVQNAGDARLIRSQGFQNVQVMGQGTAFQGVTMFKTGGQHGTDQMYSIPMLAEIAGDAMGVVFTAPNQKTLYLVGDTIWNYHVEHALQTHRPDVLVLNAGQAKLQGFDSSLIMGREDVLLASQKMPNAQIIAVHMDAVNHTTVTSEQMRQFVKENSLEKQVAVPKEGDKLAF